MTTQKHTYKPSLDKSHSMKGRPLEVFKVFLKLGLTSFGGPVAHLGYFHKELVLRRRWLSEAQFAQLLAICQFLPGPASSQLGFSLGWVRAGGVGALAAFVAFTLPSVLLLLLFVMVLPGLPESVEAALVQGLKLVACAVVADALLSMSKSLCPDKVRRTIAIVAAVTLLWAGSVWAQLLVVMAAALLGLRFCVVPESSVPAQLPIQISRRAGIGCLLLFAGFLFGLPLFAASGFTLPAVAEAFYRAGALVFGGGHVVLPLLQETVVGSGWVTPEQFLAGYGASQAIPGPMFAFSSYLGALIPEGSSVVNAVTALLFMFLPGFLLVVGVLPFWRDLSGNIKARQAIAGINAAVVGILGVALYQPVMISAIHDGRDLAVALIGFALLRVGQLSPLYVVLWCVLASLAGIG